MQVCTSLQTDNHASTPPLSFYRPDALPAAQPTVSKHALKAKTSTKKKLVKRRKINKTFKTFVVDVTQGHSLQLK